MESQNFEEFTEITLSPLITCAWDEWNSWHTISTSQPHLNDTIDFDQASDLCALSSSLAFRTAQVEEQHSASLDDHTWEAWLKNGIATAADLLAKGKQTLASEAADLVSRIVASEKGL